MDDKNVSIRLLEKNEWKNILNLQVSITQKKFIETSAECLEDAMTNAYKIKWNFYGVYLEDKLIGFAMHGEQKIVMLSQTWLDRFMIDENYQGKGYGKKALQLIIAKLFMHYKCKKIHLSVCKENTCAIMLYQKLGFAKTIFKDSHGEKVMICKKNSATRI